MTPAAEDTFVNSLIASGHSPKVAEEIERRIEIVESAEAADESRLPLSSGELALYVGTAVVACIVALAVLAL